MCSPSLESYSVTFTQSFGFLYIPSLTLSSTGLGIKVKSVAIPVKAAPTWPTRAIVPADNIPIYRTPVKIADTMLRILAVSLTILVFCATLTAIKSLINLL